MSLSLITKGKIGEITIGEARDPYIFAVALDITVPELVVAVETPSPPEVAVSVENPVSIAVSVDQPTVTITTDEEGIGVEVCNG